MLAKSSRLNGNIDLGLQLNQGNMEMNRHCRILTPRTLSLLLGLLVVGACQAGEPSASSPAAARISEKPMEDRMWMTINQRRFAITLTDNDTARAFAAQLPLTLDVEELNGNEKHAKLPTSLPTGASRPGIIRNGNIMLYGDDTLVVFYSTFNSMYSYTRIGRVDDTARLAETLGSGNARITFSMK
jgi:hypothetical protein